MLAENDAVSVVAATFLANSGRPTLVSHSGGTYPLNTFSTLNNHKQLTEQPDIGNRDDVARDDADYLDNGIESARSEKTARQGR